MFFQILFRIALVIGFAAVLPPLRAATVVTADGLEIDMDRSDSESLATIDELRALERQITTLFRVSGRRLPLRCRVTVSGDLPPGELRADFRPQEWILSFNDRGNAWRDSFRLRRRLTGLMLLSKVPGAEVPPSPDYLPGWVAAGIASRLRSSKESELILSRNRYFPVLRALSEQGKFPDFRQMRTLTPELLAPPAMEWYRELSRVMLDCGSVVSSSADNALLDYCLLAARPGSIEEQNFKATLGRLFLAGAEPEGVSGEGVPGSPAPPPLSDDEKIQRVLERYARLIAFNEFFPQPAPLTAAAFEAAMKFELPVLGADGRPTGEMTDADLFNLPELLPGRRDAGQLRETLRSRLLALGAGNDRAFAQELAALAEDLYRLPLAPQARPAPPPSPAERFRQRITRIRNGLERRAAIESFLAAAETEFQPPSRFYGAAVREARRPSPVLSPEAQKFLEQVESEWLDD
ncbi:MAG: hypothetical protein HPZ91_06635 [Lentisphaeria bacterium]|nr:hypothetical protein [Lentisphaeria bacterium]